MQNVKQIQIVNMLDTTITPGEELNFVHSSRGITALGDSLISDGQSVVINSIKYYLRAYQVNSLDEEFHLLPIVIQYASGTFSTTTNLGDGKVSEILDLACSSEFGFQRIGNLRVSKAAPGGASLMIETQFEIPRNIINILNKEVSTTRDQIMSLALVGAASENVSIAVVMVEEITFSTKAKGITIR